jgi:DNA-binding response OmpR family regulator
MRILVVDDEPAILELLRTACEADGHDVTSAETSLLAKDHLAAHKVDLLITDIVMPPPDGLQLVRDARALQPNLMAIVMTGHSSKYSLEEVLATGASDLLIKPFRVQELRARVALADERRRMIESLHARRIALQQASAEMIRGLEQELVDARRPLAQDATKRPAAGTPSSEKESS